MQSYVVMVQQLGSLWLERHLTTVLQHLLDLAAQPRAAPTHVDAVYSRQCIAFVLRSLLGKMLGEKQQIAACKELASIINQQMNSIGACDTFSASLKAFSIERVLSIRSQSGECQRYEHSRDDLQPASTSLCSSGTGFSGPRLG